MRPGRKLATAYFALAGILAGLLPLAGCSAAGEEWSLKIEGGFGAPVSITTTGQARLSDTRVSIESSGDGVEISSGSPILFRATSFDSRTDAPVHEYDTGQVRLSKATADSIGDIAQFVTGMREGTRLIIERPGLIAGDASAVEIAVVDILYTNARGERLPVPEPGNGMPGIGEGEGAGPVLTQGGGPISELRVVPLVAGEGIQVGGDDAVALQYVLANTEGQIYESTWMDGGPRGVAMSELMEGLRTSIRDQKVGSRLAILIPAAKANGDHDLVAIVDVLGVLGSS